MNIPLPEPSMHELKKYLNSRKLVFCKTPEELRKELIKFEWKKEDKMDENMKRIYEIDSKISELVKLFEALKELVPKVIEKEVGLKDGQIYKCHAEGYAGTYYLLITDFDRWKLVNLSNPEQTWSNWRSAELTKSEIEKFFTLCPTAFIHVIRGDYGHSGKE